MKTLFIIVSLLGIVLSNRFECFGIPGCVSGQGAYRGPNRATIERINRMIRRINSLTGEAKAQEQVRLYYLLQEELEKRRPKYQIGMQDSKIVTTTTTKVITTTTTSKGNRKFF